MANDAPTLREVEKVEKALNDFLGQSDALDIACAKATENAISGVLRDFGINPELSAEDTQKALLEQEMMIREVQFEGAPQVAGIYIFKKNDCVAYVSYPFLNKEGQVGIRVERYDRNVEVAPTGLVLPKGIVKGT